jgi:hypothetical protein
MRQQDGDVVLAAGSKHAKIDEHLTLLVGLAAVAGTSAMRSSLTMSVKPLVQSNTASREMKTARRRPDDRRCADRVGEMCRRSCPPLDRHRAPAGGEMPFDGMVAGQERQGAISEQIRPRMADVRDDEGVAGGVDGGERSGHVFEGRIPLAALHDRFVGAFVVPHGALEELRGGLRIDP